MSDARTEIPQSIQSLPSVGAILIWLTEKPLEWWAALMGLVFLLMQTLHMAWKWRREYLAAREADQEKADAKARESALSTHDAG